MPRLRRRAAGLFGGAALLFFLAANVQAGWLYVLAAFLLGTVAAGWVLPALMVRRIRVERRAPSEAFQGQPVTVDLAIEDGSRGMRLGIVVRDAHLAPTLAYAAALRPGERVELATERVPLRRGLQGPTPVVVSSTGPFGVAEVRRRVEVAGETLVFPAVAALGRLPFVSAADTHERSIHPYPRPGQGPEFLGVREYRPGDGIRHVHWPSTARRGALVVREFEEETTRRLAIVVDTSRDAGETWTPLDRCCSVAASVALAAVSQGHGARLIAARDGRLDVLTRADDRAMLGWLALLKSFGGLPFDETVRALGPEMRGVQTAMLVFPAWRGSLPSVPEAVGELVTRVPRVVALVVEVDPVADATDAALPSAAVDELTGALASAGAEVFRWAGQEEDLAAVLGSEREMVLR